MGRTFGSIIIGLMLMVTASWSDVQPVKVTFYCDACSPNHETASGRWEEYYSVASSDYPLGSIIYINGIQYRVDDTGCASGIIDVLIPTDENGNCECDSYGYYNAIAYVK